MSQTFHPAFHWAKPVLITSIPLVLLIGFLVVTRPENWWFLIEVIVVVWILFTMTQLIKTRAMMQIDDDNNLLTREWWKTHTVSGTDVVEVKGIFNGKSPNIKLVCTDGHKVLVPTSMFHSGHSGLFCWLKRYAPQARYDKEADKIRDLLIRQGSLN